PLLWARPLAHDWICDDQRTAQYARAKPGTGTRFVGGRRADDSHRLELCARRSPAVVTSSTAPYQRSNGHLRHLVAGHFISRPSLVADSGHHTRVRHWSDDRVNEDVAHSFESAERALVPFGSRHRRGLRNLHCADLAEDA